MKNDLKWGATLLAGLLMVSVRAEPPVFVAERLADTALPYVWGAGDPALGGLDCSGFVQVVFRRAYGIDLPDEAGKQYEYLRQHGYVWDASTGWNPQDLRPGDLIFWSGTYPCTRSSPITHVMVYIGDSKMVGSQSAGHRLNAIGAGVGYYPFKPYSPRGNPLVAQDQFRHRPTLYGYGRVVAPVATVP